MINQEKESMQVIPSQKIKVFISSKCDRAEEPPKYDPIRAELKQSIEKTGLAEVYTFEGEEASTLSAGVHYTFALEDSDVCIFLIDNADGIPDGVKAEIDVVQRNNIKALYYFCDESQKEKTPLEKSLMGANFAKSKTVHTFSELSKNGATALLSDIVRIYHYYCQGKISLSETEFESTKDIDITSVSTHQNMSFPKSVLKNIDKTTDYILRSITGISFSRFPDDPIQTSELDDWGVQFLPIMFEGKTIKEFNVSMFLECLKSMQDKEVFNVVSLRWQAIQSYFSGNIDDSIKHLGDALKIAKDTKQPSWIIKDILIDLRNQHWELCEQKNTYFESEAQKELDESQDELYYPVIDRCSESLQEKYIQGLYKHKTESPYTVSLGGNLNEFGKLLASTFIVAMYNGSLTHILMLFDKAKEFLFYLSSRYDDWSFRRDLLKYAIRGGKEKEVVGIQNTFPEILSKLSDADAEKIMDFCSIHPITHKRIRQQLLGFATVGYYLNDEKFRFYESSMLKIIYAWIDDEDKNISIGESVFKNLLNVSHRLSQDVLAEICCKFVEKHLSRWYMDMFKLISKRIDINKMREENAKNLITSIIDVVQNDCELVKRTPFFLCVIRNQNRELTNELDKTVETYLPEFYNNNYRLETTENKASDYPVFLNKYLEIVKHNNETQGKNGRYFGRGTREIATIKSILLDGDQQYEDSLLDSIILAVSQTLLESKESLSTKMDAVALLCCIIEKYPKSYERNKDIYRNILENESQIIADDSFPFSSNIDNIALTISLKILFSAMGIDVHADLLELFPYLKDNIATTISVTSFIANYLELSSNVAFQKPIETTILHYAFAWIHTDYVDIRWNSTRILLALLRNADNREIINRHIVSLIERDNVYIKNLILQHILHVPGITKESYEYIIETCKHDANYVTRMVCSDIERKQTLVE